MSEHKRYFTVTAQVAAIIELDPAVIDVVDDEWRRYLYDLHTPKEIAEHIGYNMIANRWPLSALDGWADQPDSNAKYVIYPEWDNITATEISAGQLAEIQERLRG